MLRLASIVEGHGELEAVPILIRRIAQTLDPALVPEVHPIIRVPAAKLIRPGEIERAVQFTARAIAGQGGILVLLDCDDGCPAHDGPALLARAQRARPDVPVSVVLAKREFEAWFLAAAISLRGQRGLPSNLMPPSDPEAIRGAKEWLQDRMAPGRSYTVATDQPALAATFDLQAARRADSFDKCHREVVRLLDQLRHAPPEGGGPGGVFT